MNECLRCQQVVKKKAKFTDILLFAKDRPSLCQHCLSSFEPISEEHCQHCWKEGVSGSCSDCQEWEKEGHKVSHQALFTYNSAMKDFFSAYKFQGDYLLRYAFADQLRKVLRPYKTYTIVAIPVSQEKFHIRGFNQVEAFLNAANIKFERVLEKRDTEAQSSKTRADRLKTPQVFSIKEGKTLPEKILLVDDIYTTGKTLQLAKEILLQAGVKEVLTFSLSR